MNEQLIKPEPTAEVAEFLGAWDKYLEVVRGFRTGSLSTYGRDYLSIVANNEVVMSELDKAVYEIRNWANGLNLLGEEVAQAAAEYQSALYEYNEAVKNEADKPRREWEKAKDDMTRTLEKEKRGLAIKIGRLSNKRWSVSAGEKELMDAQIELMRGRESIVEQLLSDVYWMRYSDYEGTIFSDELVATANLRNRERINEIIAQLDAERLIEVDA